MHLEDVIKIKYDTLNKVLGQFLPRGQTEDDSE